MRAGLRGFVGCLSSVQFNQAAPLKAALQNRGSSAVSVHGRLEESDCGAKSSTNTHITTHTGSGTTLEQMLRFTANLLNLHDPYVQVHVYWVRLAYIIVHLSIFKHRLIFLSVCFIFFFSLLGDESSKSDRGKAPLTKGAQSDSALIGGEKQQELVCIQSGITSHPLTLIILHSVKFMHPTSVSVVKF